MDIFSNRVDKSKIKPGDHTYTYRAVFAYSHHVIFAGGHQVIHFTPEINSKTALSSSICCSCSSIPSSCLNIHTIPHYGIRLPGSGVVLSCLDCFLGNGSAYSFGYAVSSFSFLLEVRGGTCTTAKSDSSNTVLHRAMYLLLTRFGKFDVRRNNCEDFALYCKTGLLIVHIGAGTSGQASSVVAGASWSASAIISKLLMPSLGTMVVGTAGMCHLNRYRADIGVRSDVIKVEVEVLLPIKMMFEGLESS